MAQLQCGLLVSGREWIDYVSYCGGMPMYVKRVLPDPVVRRDRRSRRRVRERRRAHERPAEGNRPLNVPLLITRGKSAMFTVQPLADAPTPTSSRAADTATSDQLASLGDGLKALGITDRDAMVATASQVIDREIKSALELTRAEAAAVLDWIKHEQSAETEPTLPEADK
jgi:hypothetical protein